MAKGALIMSTPPKDRPDGRSEDRDDEVVEQRAARGRAAPVLPRGDRVVTTPGGGRILTHGPSAFAPDDGSNSDALDISKLGKDGVAAELARRMAAFRAQTAAGQMQAEAPKPAVKPAASAAAKPNAPHPFLRASEMRRNPAQQTPAPRPPAQRRAEPPGAQPVRAAPRVEPTFTRATPEPAPDPAPQADPRLQRWDEPWLGEAEPSLAEERRAAEEAVAVANSGADVTAPAYRAPLARPRRGWGRRVVRSASLAACLGSAAGAAMIWSFHGSEGMARQLSFLGAVEVEISELTSGLTGDKPAPQQQPAAPAATATSAAPNIGVPASSETPESDDAAQSATASTAPTTPAVAAPQSVSSDFAAPDLAESAQPTPSDVPENSTPSTPAPSESQLASAAPAPETPPADADDAPAYLVPKPFEPHVLTLPDVPTAEIGAAPVNRPQFPAITNGASGAATGVATAAVPPLMTQNIAPQPAIGTPNATAAPAAAPTPRVVATLKPAQPAASTQPKAKPYKSAAQPAKPAKPAKQADPLDQIIKLLTTPNGSAPPKPDYGNKK
jgi:hypothetical protein